MFSKACKYAIRAVLYLAVNSNEDRKAGVVEVAEALDVPRHFLAKILQQLSKHNIISSVKGPNGGFFLSEQNLGVSLLTVVECIDGPEVFSACLLGLPVCSSENPCPLHTQAYAYREGLLFQLKFQSIKEVAEKVQQKELKI